MKHPSLLLALALLASPAEAAEPARGSTAALFSIAKSENKNQVQYDVRVDGDCVPAGDAPVFAYWRMLEEGPARTAPILSREQRGYGLESQTVLARTAEGGTVRIVLRALPGRAITVETGRGAGGACRALATMAIAGLPAHLFNVYVRLKWDGVDFLLLRGWTMDGARVVEEKIAG
jgi:hypothetical protein